VADAAANAHVRHGDYIGTCRDGNRNNRGRNDRVDRDDDEDRSKDRRDDQRRGRGNGRGRRQ